MERPATVKPGEVWSFFSVNLDERRTYWRVNAIRPKEVELVQIKVRVPEVGPTWYRIDAMVTSNTWQYEAPISVSGVDVIYLPHECSFQEGDADAR